VTDRPFPGTWRASGVPPIEIARSGRSASCLAVRLGSAAPCASKTCVKIRVLVHAREKLRGRGNAK
jgi:hypothetical protein